MTNHENYPATGGAMNLNEQGGEYLKLCRDHAAAQREIAASLSFLRTFGQTLAANSKILKEDASRWNPDEEWLVSDVREAVRKAKRCRDLLAQDAEIVALRDKFMLE
jgi:hypothetical protein